MQLNGEPCEPPFYSLGSFRSTIELRPRISHFSIAAVAFVSFLSLPIAPFYYRTEPCGTMAGL
jgi:hypothetical protein